MNEIYTIVRLLENAGLRVQGADDGFIYLEDPSCVLRAFENFLDYAWMAIAVVTAGLIIGWGISMIRGAKNALTENFKTLILIFGILSAMWPILNVVSGGNLPSAVCKTIKVSISNVNEILATKPKNANSASAFYEDIDIYDSGPIQTIQPEPGKYSSLDEFMNEYANDDASYTQSVNVSAPIVSNGARVVSAIVNPAIPDEIIYTRADGTKYASRGGDFTKRANNPGALAYTPFTRRMGATGANPKGLAIFPDAESGRNALVTLLKTPAYQNKTLVQAMYKYAPPVDGNNPQSYAIHLAQRIGVPANTYLRDMTEAQLARMIQGISEIEGKRPPITRDL